MRIFPERFTSAARVMVREAFTVKALRAVILRFGFNLYVGN